MYVSTLAVDVHVHDIVTDRSYDLARFLVFTLFF